jgi:hypothetical protein
MLGGKLLKQQGNLCWYNLLSQNCASFFKCVLKQRIMIMFGDFVFELAHQNRDFLVFCPSLVRSG